MTNQLTKVSELLEMLECEDERTALRWCEKNRIPVMKAGKAKYVATVFIQMFFEYQLKRFVNAKYENPEEVMKAYKADDTIGLYKAMQIPLEKEVKKQYVKSKKEHSKAANDLLNNLRKSA